MPRVHKQKAQKNFYTKKGTKHDLTCKKCNKHIQKGEEYFKYQFRFGGPQIHCLAHPPTKRDLTRSGFAHAIFDIEDAIEGITPDLDLESAVQDISEQVNTLMEETQDSLDNMPEHLQDSSDSGILLQERIDNLEAYISDLESVDTSIDEDMIEEEVEDEHDEDEWKELTDKEKEALVKEKVEEYKQTILDEIQGLSLEC